MRLITSTAPRAAPYDRNPTSQVSNYGLLLSENTGEVIEATYTVPSGRKAHLASIQQRLLCQVAATSVVSTDLVYAPATLTPSGGAATTIATSILHVDSMVAGTADHYEFSPGLVLQAGDVVTLRDRHEGSAGGAGRVRSEGGISRTEFDA